MKSFRLLPSVDRLIDGAIIAVKRFPLALACAVVGTVVAIILTDRHDAVPQHDLINLALAAALGLPFFIVAALKAEKDKWTLLTRAVIQGVALIALVLYYFSLPRDLFAPHYHAFRFLLLILGLHFLVAFAPFAGRGQLQGFWQYNKSLLISFATAVIYSAALYIGFAIALAAANFLFNIEIKSERYFELWQAMAGVVNTWIFLALIPRDLDALETTDTYPTGLKIFSQYVLLPLVGLYFVILIAYEAKIIVEWNWPKGWVSELVLWYAVVGLLSLLLLHPLKSREENKWILRFEIWFFRLLIPLVIMLFLSMRRRIADYGVTEPRYLALALAVGLAVVVVYFILSRRKDIRIVPIVLFCLAIVAAYGPLSASSISTWSQRSRLESLLVKNGLLKDGVPQKPATEIPLDNRREMSSVISYLTESRGPEAFEGLVPDSTVKAARDKYTSRESRSTVNENLATALGFVYDWSPFFEPSGKYVSLWADELTSLDIGGYERMIKLGAKITNKSDSSMAVPFDDYTCHAELVPESPVLLISFVHEIDSARSEIRLDLSKRVEELYVMNNPRNIPQDSLVFDRTIGDFDARIYVTNLSGERREGKLVLNWVQAQILLHRRK